MTTWNVGAKCAGGGIRLNGCMRATSGTGSGQRWAALVLDRPLSAGIRATAQRCGGSAVESVLSLGLALRLRRSLVELIPLLFVHWRRRNDEAVTIAPG